MHSKFVIVLFSIQLWCVAVGGKAFGQSPGSDTLRITLKETEAQFLKNNLDLIVQHYSIDQAQAQIITARLFNNPDFSFANVLYNPQTKKFFDTSHDGGEYSAQNS